MRSFAEKLNNKQNCDREFVGSKVSTVNSDVTCSVEKVRIKKNAHSKLLSWLWPIDLF